jgi:hypothetical protein
MVSMQSQPTRCPAGQPLKLKVHRTCIAGKVLRLSAQTLETMSTMPSQACQVETTVGSASPTRSNTPLFTPQVLIPTTWAQSFSVKDKQLLIPVCRLLHRLQAYRLRVHSGHSKPLPWRLAHQARASHANTSACVRRAAKRSGLPRNDDGLAAQAKLHNRIRIRK